MTSSPLLSISPKSCLQDEKVTLRISGLHPNASYTVTSHLKDIRKNKYFSFAHYNADDDGVIDTSQDKSLGGHYEGLFQMGLVAALQPEPSENRHLRLFKKDVETPNKIEFRLYDKFQTPEEIFSSQDSYLVNDFHYRHFMGPGVTRHPIREGRVRATLFIPSGEGPFPGVVDMFGTAGGLLEYRSAQLASRGIASLALAFFDYEDLPKKVHQYDMDYFKEAVQVLLNHEKVLKPYIGALGVSKGGDLAISIGTFIPEVTAVVSINGSCSNTFTPLKIHDGYVLPSLDFEISRAKNIGIQKSDAKFLFIIGEDDKNMPCMKYGSISANLMRKANKDQNIRICTFKGAGHLLEPPYSAHCPSSYHKVFGCVIIWGGELKAHAEAQEISWVQIIHFIKSNLKMKSSKL